MRILGLLAAAILMLLLAGVWYIAVRWPNDERPTASQQTSADLLQVATALELYRNEYGRYPTGEEGLEVLAVRFIAPNELYDGWGRRLRYERLSQRGEQTYRVCSAGADGEAAHMDTGDDQCFSPD